MRLIPGLSFGEAMLDGNLPKRTSLVHETAVTLKEWIARVF